MLARLKYAFAWNGFIWRTCRKYFSARFGDRSRSTVAKLLRELSCRGHKLLRAMKLWIEWMYERKKERKRQAMQRWRRTAALSLKQIEQCERQSEWLHDFLSSDQYSVCMYDALSSSPSLCVSLSILFIRRCFPAEDGPQGTTGTEKKREWILECAKKKRYHQSERRNERKEKKKQSNRPIGYCTVLTLRRFGSGALLHHCYPNLSASCHSCNALSRWMESTWVPTWHPPIMWYHCIRYDETWWTMSSPVRIKKRKKCTSECTTTKLTLVTRTNVQFVSLVACKIGWR